MPSPLLRQLPVAGSRPADRAEQALAHGTPAPLAADLRALLGTEQVLTSASDLVRYASDASPYRMIPQAVVQPRSIEDVAAICRYAASHGRTITFRAAGTSLNGQSQGDGILVDVRRRFSWARPEDGGEVLAVGCGMVLARANAQLAPLGRKLGPDPASSGAATVGGVIANNASGMAAGTRWNAYATLRSMVFALPSGTIVDTAAPDADERLRAAEPELVAGIEALREEIRGDDALVARLRSKFSIKNTNGYRLDAFCDEGSPVQILRRLLIGSQGTLGFVSEARMETVPIGRLSTTAFLLFADLHAAAAAVPVLMRAGARTAELMDCQSLRDTAHIPGAPAWQHELADGVAGVLTDLRADDEDTLAAFEERVMAELGEGVIGGEFTRDPRTAGGYWAVRSGVLPAIGGARPQGTVVLAEDVCVQRDAVADAAVDLGEVLARHGFPSAVQGHASAGNLHFILLVDTTDETQLTRYRAVMDDVADLIVDRYDGSLKGEHATGRNMAPYLRKEWGDRIVGLMRRVKDLIDPAGILSPGVILDDDPLANVRHLKSLPPVQAELDPCIECGFCEPVCPSRDVTTTPRQRIVLEREIARQGGRGELAERLAADFSYEAVETCAGDSSCAIACPVDIDTGAAMKHVRRAAHGRVAEGIAAEAARHWGAVTRVARIGVGALGAVARRVGDRPLGAASALARRVGGSDLVPAWIGTMPRGARRLPTTADDGAGAVYLPACINRIFGVPADAGDALSVVEAVVALGERAGVPVSIPDGVGDLCCGTVWHSKGFERGEEIMARRLLEALWRFSDGGRRPIVVDASSCTLGMAREILPHLTEEQRQRHARIEILDALTWARREILPRLETTSPAERAVLHPTCSMAHLGLEDDLVAVASASAREVVRPVATCCGFAGDRGFLHPELTEAATAQEREDVLAVDADAHLSGNRTCELGMEHATGKAYESALVALERATR